MTRRWSRWSGGISIAGSLRIETFEGSRPQLAARLMGIELTLTSRMTRFDARRGLLWRAEKERESGREGRLDGFIGRTISAVVLDSYRDLGTTRAGVP